MNALAVSFCLLAASAAAADEVILHNGATIRGVVREEGDRVVVELPAGTMTLKRIDVRWILRNGAPAQEPAKAVESDESREAQGLVKHEGRWLPKETAEKALELQVRAQLERERMAAEERIAAMQREVELVRLAVERERIEAERNRGIGIVYGTYYPSSWLRTPCLPGITLGVDSHLSRRTVSRLSRPTASTRRTPCNP